MAQNGVSELNSFHADQLMHILRFAQVKREQHVREIEATFQETADSRLTMDDYTQSEVENLLKDVKDVVKASLREELLHSTQVYGVLVQQLLTQAERQDVSLMIDTAELENKYLIDHVAKLEAACSKADPTKKAGVAPQLAKNLAPIGAETAAVKDQAEQLLKENTMLKDRLGKLQAQTMSVLREKTAMNTELQTLKDRFSDMAKEMAARGESTQAAESMRQSIDSLQKMTLVSGNDDAPAPAPAAPAAPAVADQSAEIRSLTDSLDFTKKMLAAKEKDYAALEKKLDDKVNNSPQFLQLKKMMTAKNEEIKKLRSRLAKYEPDDTPLADED